MVRTDAAGATHELLDCCREGAIGLWVGFDLTEAVRAAILDLPEPAWVAATNQDDGARDNGQSLRSPTASTSPAGRKTRGDRAPRPPAPGRPAVLPQTTTATASRQILTDQTDPDIAVLERRHRARARDHIETTKRLGKTTKRPA